MRSRHITDAMQEDYIHDGLLRLLITYFNAHFTSRDQATISWFKLRKCGVIDSAFFCLGTVFATIG